MNKEKKKELALKLLKLRNQKRKIEKEEREVKEEIMGFMKGNVLTVGDVILLLSDKLRTTLNKAALLKDKGKDFVSQYESTTHYQVLEVKKIK